MIHSLVLHSASTCDALVGIAVEVARKRTGRLVLRYVATGAIANLRLPPSSDPTRTDELWKHTCFEAFVSGAEGEAYCEFNFSPSSQWAAYRFDGYRRGMRQADGVNIPAIEVQATDRALQLRAVFSLSGLAGLPPTGAWRMGLAAVIEEASGRKSYWALSHPPGKPDFHQRDCFVLELPETSVS